MPLYKYLHPDRVDVLLRQRIRFSTSHVLNDPFEFAPHVQSIAGPEYVANQLPELAVKVFEDEIKKLPELAQGLARHMFTQKAHDIQQAVLSDFSVFSSVLSPELQDLIREKCSEMLGVLCLTEDPDSLLMWAHYADSHRGFVIQFDERSSFFDRRVSTEDWLRHLRKVEYRSERPALILAEAALQDMLLVKGEDWRYENEWRMVCPLSLASEVIGEGEGAVHLFQFPPQAVQKIILGSRMSEVTKATIRGLLQTNTAYAHVACIEAKIDSRQYRVAVS